MDMPLTDRPHRKAKAMIRSSSSTLDTTRSRTRTLFPRLPSASNITINPRNKGELTSRTIEACRRTGIKPRQILPVKSPKTKNVNESVLELRRTFAEKERLKLLKQVDFIRRNLIDDDWDATNTNKDLDSLAIPPKTPKLQSRLVRKFAQNELARNKTARRKSMKINSLISKRWEHEAKRVQKVKNLQKANTIMDATRRHSEHIQNIVNKTKQINKENEQKALKARELIERELKVRNEKICARMKLTNKKIHFNAKVNEKQRKECIKRQKMRFKEHQMNHQRQLHEQKQYNRQRKKNVRKKHKMAERSLSEKRQQFKQKRLAETRAKRQKMKAKMADKTLRDKQYEKAMTENFAKVEARMREVSLEKQLLRAELKKKSLLKNDRVSIVKKANESKRSEFAQKLYEKEQQTEKRLKYCQQKKEEERLLRQELSKLRKKQRKEQVERDIKKDEYMREILEHKLAKRDEKLAIREQTRKKVIAKQRKYNDRIRLLRAELSYQFDHLNEDEITSPVAISRFSDALSNANRNIQPKILNTQPIKTEE
eukprot:36280_1